ncbi:MAG: GxxExxY protein [Candidatus Omnitrophica bacterium]|nr:GxxExxY protein [Candidatus Omnitrophota bacterium]
MSQKKDNANTPSIIYKKLSYQLQGAFFQIYKTLGNYFKESVYHKALLEELSVLGINFKSEERINIYYRNKKVGVYVPDIIIADLILVEIKSKPCIIQTDIKQFWQYLQGSSYKVGYLVNFGSIRRVELIRRVYDTARQK